MNRKSAEDKIRELLRAGMAAKLFPGAVAAIGVGGAAPVFVAAGAHTYDDGAALMSPRTVFDVASLTKVLVTTTAVLQMVDQQRLALSDAVGTFLPPFRAPDKDKITVRHLLTHTSGLRADVGVAALGEGDWGRVTAPALWDVIDQAPLTAPPGTQHLYSDLGFLLLGRIVELVSESTLDAYAAAHIFNPLGMDRTRYCPPPEWWPEAAPTEYDARWRGALQGRVHDEKAFVLGGVAGHAGLFSNAEDLHRFLQALLQGLSGHGRFVLSETLTRAMTQNQTPDLPVPQGLGWFLDGAFLGGLRPHAFGHTGFTGVSAVVAPRHSLVCLLLTNCVYPTRPDPAARRRLNEIRAETAGLALTLSAEA